MHLGTQGFHGQDSAGYRVELGEIERAIASHPDVNDVGVVAWDRGLGENT
jgi:acyl-coenzyme A synthetase/AMP-(fatty) acid ligase